ncbi:MAG: phosphopantothenoylcysteine decarboxylase [Mycoplasmatales bacterium]
MKILITAGGTSEKIDNVRSITNKSTGMLGQLIAEEYVKETQVKEIHYICNAQSCKPDTQLLNNEQTIIIHEVVSVEDVRTLIVDLLAKMQFDVIVHAMAISDYYVKNITSLESISQKLTVKEFEEPQTKMVEQIKTLIQTDESLQVEQASGKISSTHEQLLLVLEKTPKIIGEFKRLAPKSLLVGFKLLDNVSTSKLHEIGFNLLEKNDCDFVIANDLQKINQTKHQAYLLTKTRETVKMETKQEIAQKIVEYTLRKGVQWKISY